MPSKLSDEPIGEPHSWISRLAQTSEIEIKVLDVGEFFEYRKE